MNAREKAYWLVKVNPYKQQYMSDAFKDGARAFWTGTERKWLGNSRERAAFHKGYAAAEAAEKGE